MLFFFFVTNENSIIMWQCLLGISNLVFFFFAPLCILLLSKPSHCGYHLTKEPTDNKGTQHILSGSQQVFLTNVAVIFIYGNNKIRKNVEVKIIIEKIVIKRILKGHLGSSIG